MNDDFGFEIAYGGPALKSHRMDVRNLAPALLAWDSLVGRASDLVSNRKAEARLQVQGSFKEGFLEPLLKIVETAAEIFRDD